MVLVLVPEVLWEMKSFLYSSLPFKITSVLDYVVRIMHDRYLRLYQTLSLFREAGYGRTFGFGKMVIWK